MPSPREVFEHMQRSWLAADGGRFDDLLADDAVVEMPFAPAGRASRIEGRERFRAFAAPQRAAFPVRFDEVRDVVVHDTADPEVIVVEYELAGTVTTTGRRASAPFIGVLRVHNGKIARWREYQDMPAITAALLS
ncbi:MAG: nuclear transport factor 2 family protein [Catenulispora sp.]|nr:nuclear transport factor 2 family protein [Catenulispora sp.]